MAWLVKVLLIAFIRLMATESSLPVAESVTEQKALRQAIDLGLGDFGAFTAQKTTELMVIQILNTIFLWFQQKG